MQVYDQENQKQEQKVISHLKKKQKKQGVMGDPFPQNLKSWQRKIPDDR